MSRSGSLRGASILLDTNLVVPWCVYLCGGDTQRFKNSQIFDATDIAILARIVASASRFYTLSYVVAESSNLLSQGAQSHHRLAALKRYLLQAREVSVSIETASGQQHFERLGATDCAILCALRQKPDLLLLTVDAVLHDVASRAALPSINFNHVREAARSDFR